MFSRESAQLVKKIQVFLYLMVIAVACLTAAAPAQARTNSTYRGTVKIAAVQTSPRFADKAYNLNVMLAKTAEAAGNGANLIVFPELALTGYKFANTAEGLPYAEPVPGPSTQIMARQAAQLGVYIVFGMLETDGQNLYDAVVFVGPEGFIGKYEKIHMGHRSEALTFTRGSKAPPVFDTPIGRIGIASCYDGAFPETGRRMGVQGAQIMVLIDTENGTTWRDYVRSRAAENGAYAVVANRVGGERLSTFNGYSLIAGPDYQLLANAGTTNEETIYADVDLGALGDSFVSQRRPELYGALTEPLDEQILSVDLEPRSNVTGTATVVDTTVVTASHDEGERVTATLKGPDGRTYATAKGKLGVDSTRVRFTVPATAPAGEYTVEAAVGEHRQRQVSSADYTIKATAKPGVLAELPVGAGAARSSTIYVSFDEEVETSTNVPFQLVGPAGAVTLTGAINNAGVDNRLSAAYSNLAYGAAYEVIVPAGSVRSVAHGTYNDEARFTFTVQPQPTMVDAAAVQMDPQHLDVAANLATVLGTFGEAAVGGADLVVFPELALTGTNLTSRAQAASVAESVPGPSTNALVAKAKETGAYAVVGLVERDGKRLYDTIVLVGPNGLVGKHRSTHLSPSQDGVFDQGNAVSPVFASTLGPIGLTFGYENYFPEVIRSLSIRGALLLTGSYADDGVMWQELARTRASENKVYVIAANRVGTDNGVSYGGKSLIASTSRKINAQAGATSTEIVKASLDMYEITKRYYSYIDRATGKVRSTHYFLDRRPNLYGSLTKACVGRRAAGRDFGPGAA